MPRQTSSLLLAASLLFSAIAPGCVAATDNEVGEVATTDVVDDEEGALKEEETDEPDDDADPPVKSAPPPKQQEAYFNEPSGGQRDLELEDRLLELIDGAADGSKITMSIFTLTRSRVVKHLLAAAKRPNGVDVHIVLDGKPGNRPKNNALVAKLRAELGEARVSICDAACLGVTRNHNKFYLFSALKDGSKHVVVQSSANLTNSQLKLWNNLVVIRDDLSLYKGYLAYFRDLAENDRDASYNRVSRGSDTGTKAWHFPRNQGDVVIDALSNVECKYGDGKTTRIRVAMAIFTAGRANVAKRLAALKKEGCSVRVVLGRHVNPTIRSILEKGKVSVRRFDSKSTFSVHSKILLIDGKVDGGVRRLVYTGSHNYSNTASRFNDETLIRLTSSHVAAQFSGNFSRVWDAAE